MPKRTAPYGLLLSGWRDQGVIALDGRTLTLIDLPSLRGLAEMEA